MEAIYTADGDPVYYNVEDGEIKLQPIAPEGKDYDGVQFTDLNTSALEVPEKLIELGLYPAPGYEGTDYFWLDTDGERIVIRGGDWSNGANAGVFYFNGPYSRACVCPLGRGLPLRFNSILWRLWISGRSGRRSRRSERRAAEIRMRSRLTPKNWSIKTP